MAKYLFILLALFTSKAFACASFVADMNNQRSGGSTKHFFSHLNEQRRLILKNETNEPCELRLETLDLLQRIDGSYRYAAFQAGRILYRSLSNGLSIIDSQGEELLWKNYVLKPNEILITRISLTDSLPGTTYTAVRAFFPANPAALALTEIYYTKEIQSPLLSLDGLKYNSANETVDYTLKGRGDSYTFVHFDLKLIDPSTGFEVGSFFPDQAEKKMFVAYIRNYWLPGMNDEKIIKSSFRVSSFTEAFISQFKKSNPGVSLPESIVLYIRPRYGIDTEGWKNHYYLSLPGKTLEIKLSHTESL